MKAKKEATVKATVKEATNKETAKMKRTVSTEQKAVTTMFRETRKVCFKLLKTIKNSEHKADILQKVDDVFAETQKKLTAIQNEAQFINRFSNLTDEEKEMLKKMLSK